MAPAGVAPGGIVLALPPPMYRQEAPRSKVFTEQAVSESIAPVNGMDAGLEKPAPPQLVVPAVVVYLSERPDGAQVVLVVLGAALLVVVVAAALDVVVVAAALLVVVVAAPVLVVVVGAERVVVVVVGAALLVVVVGAGHSDAIIEPQVPVVVTVPQVQVPALHALTTSFVQRLNTPPLNPDSPASSAQALRLHGDEGAAACPNEGAALSQKRAATTVIVRVEVPMMPPFSRGGRHPHGPLHTWLLACWTSGNTQKRGDDFLGRT